MPSWGQMLGRDGITNMTYFWHLALFPALMIALTMLGFTLMGDGLRDALDPEDDQCEVARSIGPCARQDAHEGLCYPFRRFRPPNA